MREQLWSERCGLANVADYRMVRSRLLPDNQPFLSNGMNGDCPHAIAEPAALPAGVWRVGFDPVERILDHVCDSGVRQVQGGEAVFGVWVEG